MFVMRRVWLNGTWNPGLRSCRRSSVKDWRTRFWRTMPLATAKAWPDPVSRSRQSVS